MTPETTETPTTERTFSQAEVDRLLSKHRPNLQKQVAELQSRVEEQTALQARYDDLVRQLEKRDAQHAEFVAEIDADLQPLIAERDAAKSRYEGYRIDVALEKAAATSAAYNGEQLTALLKPYARTLRNGEIVVNGLLPETLHSLDDAIDHLRISQPNLFFRR